MPNAALIDVLERARGLGFLGPGPVEDHLAHSSGFLAALQDVWGKVIDLGSGGGVPGLVVADARGDLEVVLLEASAKRCRFLESAVAALGLAERVRVAEGRAEVVARGDLRGSADAVLARGFGRPAATAECGAPLLRVGGVVVVSEPPGAPARWPAGPLAKLGLRPAGRTVGPPATQVLEQVAPCPPEYPRRDGMPAKRPLF